MGCSYRRLEKRTNSRTVGGGLCQDGCGWGGEGSGFLAGCLVDYSATLIEPGGRAGGQQSELGLLELEMPGGSACPLSLGQPLGLELCVYTEGQ